MINNAVDDNRCVNCQINGANMDKTTKIRIIQTYRSDVNVKLATISFIGGK